MYTLVAPCFFGTEHTLSFEVKRLGAQNVKVTDGRVAFEGDAAMIAAIASMPARLNQAMAWLSP